MAAAIPFILSQWLDNNGKPLSGGKLWTYEAGTNTPTVSFTDSTGLVPNTNPVILDSAGRANVWLAPGSYKLVMMNSKDEVLWTVDKVKPNDGGGGGIVDSDYIFEGYSARFAEQFGPTTGLMDTLAKIIKIQYVAPAITLSASGSGTIYEKGASVASTILSALVTKRSNPIDKVRFYRGATLLDTKTGTIPNGGTETHTYSTAFTDTTSFSAQVDDTQIGDNGPTTVTSNTVTFNFVYPYYVGAGAAGLSAALVAGLTKRVIASTASRQETIAAAAGQVLYFAYPASYGALTKIFDVNNFDTFTDWTLRTENITGMDGTAQSYRIYEFKNPVVAGSYQYTFVR